MSLNLPSPIMRTDITNRFMKLIDSVEPVSSIVVDKAGDGKPVVECGRRCASTVGVARSLSANVIAYEADGDKFDSLIDIQDVFAHNGTAMSYDVYNEFIPDSNNLIVLQLDNERDMWKAAECIMRNAGREKRDDRFLVVIPAAIESSINMMSSITSILSHQGIKTSNHSFHWDNEGIMLSLYNSSEKLNKAMSELNYKIQVELLTESQK